MTRGVCLFARVSTQQLQFYFEANTNEPTKPYKTTITTWICHENHRCVEYAILIDFIRNIGNGLQLKCALFNGIFGRWMCCSVSLHCHSNESNKFYFNRNSKYFILFYFIKSVRWHAFLRFNKLAMSQNQSNCYAINGWTTVWSQFRGCVAFTVLKIWQRGPSDTKKESVYGC